MGKGDTPYVEYQNPEKIGTGYSNEQLLANATAVLQQWLRKDSSMDAAAFDRSMVGVRAITDIKKNMLEEKKIDFRRDHFETIEKPRFEKFELPRLLAIPVVGEKQKALTDK